MSAEEHQPQPIPEETDIVMENTSDSEDSTEQDLEKIKLLPGSTQDGTSASFAITEEDHTLGNALRYVIMKNPDVEFCGYSIPHPSEAKLHIRIQTYGEMTAVEALKKGLSDLSDMCMVIEEKFTEKINAGGFSTEEP